MKKLLVIVSILLITSHIQGWRLMRRPFMSLRLPYYPFRGYWYRSIHYLPNVYTMRGKRMLDSNGLIECIYVNRHSFLNCNNKLIKSGDIKCETKLNLDGLNLQFDIFGIELAINSELRLYPKSFKENLFTNYKINSTSGKNVSLSINSNGSNGIIIPDRTCFSKMINLFQSSKQKTILNEVKFSENKLDLIGLIVII